MRVLYVSQYFPPEIGATQARAHDFAAALVAAGHAVTVICEFPNHPTGRLPPRYCWRLFERDRLDGIDIIRTPVAVFRRKRALTRALFYGSFALSALGAGLLLARGRVDLVVATSPPLPAAFAGAILALLRRAPLLFEVRDPWPQAAIELGELNNRLAIRLARWMESWCYRRARTVVTVSERWRREIAQRTDVPGPVEVIRNGANLALFSPQPERARALRRELGLAQERIVLYIGLHGLASPLDAFLDAAARLAHDPRTVFLFVGEGPRKADIVAAAAGRRLNNVRFLAEVERHRAAAFFSAALVALVPLAAAPYTRGCVPLKLYESWACGCPVIAAALGETAELVAQSGGGLVVAPGDADAIADAVVRLSRDAATRDEMARRGRAWVTTHASRAAQAARLIALAETSAAVR